MMTPLEAQRILNDHSNGRAYSFEEAKEYLDLYLKLAEIIEEHPLKTIQKV